MNNIFLRRAQELYPGLVQMRRYIHAHPELSFQEQGTAAYCALLLGQHGFDDVRASVAATGVVADIGNVDVAPVVIRGEMDALPIQTALTTEYASTVPGVMHACGHDAHTAMAMGAFMLLGGQLREDQSPLRPSRFRLILQPAEEAQDATGKSGAVYMIEAGVIAGAKAIIAQHGIPDLPAGTVSICDGPTMAATDPFSITVSGPGGHIAKCQVDTLLAASSLRVRIAELLRTNGLLEECLIGAGQFQANTNVRNVVPQLVTIGGSVRSFSPDIQQTCKGIVQTACSQVIQEYGAQVDLQWITTYPVTSNHFGVATIMREAASQIIGAGRVMDAGRQWLAEDFAFYGGLVPAAFMLLGTGVPGKITDLHAPNYEVPEELLPVGAAILAQTAWTLAQTM